MLEMRDYREHDAILRVLTKDEGIHSITARGLRKLVSKNTAGTQVFTKALFHVDYHEGKTMHTMRTADVLDSNRALREDLLKQAVASIVCECIGKVEPDQAQEDYALVEESLRNLKETRQPYALAALFLAIMNRRNGIEPYVEGCVHCGNTKDICAISIRNGGFVCTHCYRPETAKRYTLDELKCFRLVCRAQLAQFPILENYQEWNYTHVQMVYDFFREYSGIMLHSMRFLTHLSQME